MILNLEDVNSLPDGPVCNSFKKTKKTKPCDFYTKGGTCTKRDKFVCAEWAIRNERYLSNSQMKTWHCRRKWFNRYILRLETKEKNKRMLAGELMHEYLAWKHSEDAKLKNYAFKFDADKMSELNNIERMFLYELTNAYDSRGEFGATEIKFVNEGMKVLGYIDLFQDTVEGNIIWEHKYTTKPENYTEMTMKSQLITYFLSDLNPNIAVVNLIRVPGLRIGKNEKFESFAARTRKDIKERPGWYFQKKVFYRDQFDLDSIIGKYRFIRSEIHQAVDMYQKTGTNMFWPNDDICFSGGWACDYLQYCESGVVPFKLQAKPWSGENFVEEGWE